MIIGFTASWKIALVVIATFPINIAAGAAQMAEMTGQNIDAKDVKTEEQDDIKKSQNRAEKGENIESDALKKLNNQVNKEGESSLISSAFIHMRTVSAFSMQYEVSEQYSKMTKKGSLRRQWRSCYSGILFGLSQATTFFCYALLFWYGATLIVAGEIDFNQLMTAMMALMLGALGLGQALNGLGDQRKGLLAAQRIFRIIDEGKGSLIDGLSDLGEKPITRPIGKIELKNISFKYPTRPEVTVCKNFSLVIEPGQVVALVGPSGSGKSTIMNLLLRYYDPLSGEIFLDGVNIQDLNIRWLRSQIGYVGQEPILFSGSIRDNIANGRYENGSCDLPTLQDVMIEEQKEMSCLKSFSQITRTDLAESNTVRTENDVEKGTGDILGVPNDVVNAAKQSYAHDFIRTFSEGYHTNVGEGSVMVSGGQKQRIAIARALIKQPAVLLLDEATSALDAASERYVQQSIDTLQASKAQTTIVIAHRLSTIRNADQIIVIDYGAVVEQGTHDELLLKNGLYANLWEKQSGRK